MSEQTKSLGQSITSGALWMILLKFLERGIGTISTLILARLLFPEDFGLVALATIIAGFLVIMTEFRFDTALIQNQQTTDDHFNTAWTLAVIRGGAVAIILALCSYQIALFFNDERLTEILFCLAGLTFLNGFQNIGVVHFRKDMNFKQEFRYLLFPKIIRFVVTIAAAFYLRSYWALVIGITANQVTQFLLGYVMHHYRPTFGLKHAKSIFGFSTWLWISNIIVYLADRTDQFLIGKYTNTAKLGVYNVSYEISNLPTTELIHPMSRAMLPGLSKIGHDHQTLINMYLKAVGVITILAFPASIGILVTAPLLVPVVLGQNWLDTIPLIQVLAIGGAIRVSLGHVSSLYVACGQPKFGTLHVMLNTALRLPLLFLGMYYFDILGVAWALVISNVVGTVIGITLCKMILPLPLTGLFSTIWRQAVATGAMWFGLDYIMQQLPTTLTSVEQLLILLGLILLGALLYGFVLLALWSLSGRPNSGEQATLDFITAKFIKKPAS
ncbi:MAG: hypothetical protein CMF31_01950 [Kordiimonas sp.]|nr:hypothetical protein [Kordiimonas sp.]|tara:strand:- start:931 stop:2427 length:1497 start_codon:yes stop_codon:yes gene_type:complete